MKKKFVYLFLTVIILTGIFLRFYDLGQESFWTDEAVSIIEANQEVPSQTIDLVTKLEGSPYGHHLILHYWIKVFGQTEFSVRFISALFGVLSIIVLFFLVRLFFDDSIALLSALFLSTAMLQILYSQEARLYSVFNFFALLSTFLFVKCFVIRNLKKNQEEVNIKNVVRNCKQRHFVAYVVSMVIAMYINYLTLFLVIIHALFFIVKRKKNAIKEWLYSLLIISLLSIPLVRLILFQFLSRHQNLPAALLSRGLPEIFTKLGIFFYVLPLFFLILLFLLFIFILKRINLFSGSVIHKYKNYFSILILLILISISGLYLFLLDILIHSFSLVRHSYFLVPILYVLIAKGITLMNNQKLKTIIVLIIIFFNSFALYTYYSETTKAPWKVAMGDLEKFGGKNDLVFIDDSQSSNFLFNYYTNKEFNLIILSDITPTFKEKQLIDQSLDGNGFWFIESRSFEKKVEYLKFFNKTHPREFEKSYARELKISYFRTNTD